MLKILENPKMRNKAQMPTDVTATQHYFKSYSYFSEKVILNSIRKDTILSLVSGDMIMCLGNPRSTQPKGNLLKLLSLQ